MFLPGIAPPGLPLKSVAVHPRYNPKDYASGRVTADVALLKLEGVLPADIFPAAPRRARHVAAGDRFVIAGYGATAIGSDNGAGTPRAAAMVATGKPGNLQIRLVDPATRGERAGLGACTGDSGGPAFVETAASIPCRRGELVDGPGRHSRLRRPHRRHAARVAPRLDRRDRAAARQPHFRLDGGLQSVRRSDDASRIFPAHKRVTAISLPNGRSIIEGESYEAVCHRT